MNEFMDEMRYDGIIVKMDDNYRMFKPCIDELRLGVCVIISDDLL